MSFLSLILLLSILFSLSLFLFSLPLLFSPPPSLPSSFLSSHLPPVMYFVVSFTALLEHTSRRLLPLSHLSLSVFLLQIVLFNVASEPIYVVEKHSAMVTDGLRFVGLTHGRIDSISNELCQSVPKKTCSIHCQ